MPRLPLILLCILSFLYINIFAQQPDQDKPAVLSPQFLEGISKKISRLNDKLERQAEKALEKMYRNERRLQKKMAKLDSAKAKQLFGDIDQQYGKLANASKKRRTPQPYIPALDTLSTAFKFLDQNPQFLPANMKGAEEVTKAIGQIHALEDRFKKAENIKTFLKERRQYLKERLQGTPLLASMKKMNKEVYYYSQAVNEYKAILQDRKRMERKALSLLGKIPAFKKFAQQNSQLASLLNIPSGNNNAVAVSFTGVQTRASVQQLISNTVPGGMNNAPQFLTQQLGAANQQAAGQRTQLQMPEWEDNLGEMPDFKPNDQKTKSFLKRLELGCDLQLGKVNRFLPATGEVAILVGYKLNDNSVAGIGSSYKLGLGSGISNIRLSHQGFGLRSFIDWKIKGSIFLSGGYEKNYLPQLGDAVAASGLTGFSAGSWQESGLVGLCKKYSIGKNRKGTIQVLFDFLSYTNVPRSQPLIFRTGIKL